MPTILGFPGAGERTETRGPPWASFWGSGPLPVGLGAGSEAGVDRPQAEQLSSCGQTLPISTAGQSREEAGLCREEVQTTCPSLWSQGDFPDCTGIETLSGGQEEGVTSEYVVTHPRAPSMESILAERRAHVGGPWDKPRTDSGPGRLGRGDPEVDSRPGREGWLKKPQLLPDRPCWQGIVSAF